MQTAGICIILLLLIGAVLIFRQFSRGISDSPDSIDTENTDYSTGGKQKTSIITDKDTQPEYFKKYQYTNAEYEDGFYVQDCNKDRQMKNAMLVGILDRSYWLNNDLQDMDETKCAVFPQLAGLQFTEITRKRITPSTNKWTKCPPGEVITAILDDANTFTNPEFIKCAQLPPGFLVEADGCFETRITKPYGKWMGDFEPNEKWNMECPQLPSPSAFTAFLYSEQSDAYWLAYKCCPIRKTQ